MKKQTTILVLGVFLTLFTYAAFGQTFVRESPYDDWTNRSIGDSCHNEIKIAVHLDSESSPDGSGGEGYRYRYELSYVSYKSSGTIKFRYLFAADDGEAKRRIMAGELRSVTLTAGAQPFSDFAYSDNPNGLRFLAGYYTTEPSTTGKYEGCTVAPNSVDFFCMWNPIEKCTNFDKIKEERAKIKNDPEIALDFKNESFGDVTPAPQPAGFTSTVKGDPGIGRAQQENDQKSRPDADLCKSGRGLLDQESNSIMSRMPQSASTIAQLQTVLYLVSKLMDHLQKNCQGRPEYSEYDSMKATYDSTLNTCKSIATTPSVCVAKIGW